MAGVVVGLHVNPNGGVPKHAVQSIEIRPEGCVGDKQNDRKHHGGPRRAVCLLERRVMEPSNQRGIRFNQGPREKTFSSMDSMRAHCPLGVHWPWEMLCCQLRGMPPRARPFKPRSQTVRSSN